MPNRRRPSLAGLVTAALALGAVGLVAPPAAQAAAGCAVTYTVTSQWSGGFGAEVAVTNLGDPLTRWALEWSFPAGQTVTQHWNATLTQTGSQVSASNAAWNGSLPTGGRAQLGFNGTWAGANTAPTAFRLNGTACTGSVGPTATPTPGTTPTPTPTSTPSPTSSPTPTPTASRPPLTNPLVWQDYPDLDIVRVGDTYYSSASSFHLSPGAPVLRSYDLANWEVAGHSVPTLDFGDRYDMNGGTAYVKGIWASFFTYRPSNQTFYWGGCIDGRTYVYRARQVGDTWQRHTTIDRCYYDAGALVDTDDTMYVAHGNTSISVAQLSADGTREVRNQQVFQTPSSIGTLEGARMYKKDGSYYIWLTRPANGQYVLRSTNGPFGPYTVRQVLLDLPGPISGGGVPHQGGLVQTQKGDWYYQAFVDAYPGGRVPVIAPITWTADGWPQVTTVGGRWAAQYPAADLPPAPRQVTPMVGPDTFSTPTLSHRWEWNHDPDTTRFSTGDGLRLQTATVTTDLYRARNTLTHRTVGPQSTATIEMDVSQMRPGDRAGLAMLRDSSAWVGVKNDGGRLRVVMASGMEMNSSWQTTSTGAEVAGVDLPGTKVWLRATADIRPGAGRQALFSYSTDGRTFTRLGPGFTLKNQWQFFLGYRYGIFSYATQSLGGAVTVERFDLTTP
ncbi:cellulose binding domain-containing protein [Cellulomonas oligotrophica]|uniref:Xylosidase n=1 Tax=Cellulomonas oligotrophica TaxID=931536 RepID=A0A7Y9FEP1_9CELL|nr:cellulose binding domain-containing protein [Cellulomonas oligotrophica]NYD85946.1 beta-xylosidase [Cellulomonas oligotrophica]GIG31046.1 xylosidase [Cellulomonas oligotrophica]